MKTILFLASVIALSAGSALAQDFKVSNRDAAPGDAGPEAVYVGTPASVVKSGGYSAADSFAPSQQNAAPGDVDHTIVTSGTQVVRKQVGYSAASNFGPTYD